MLEKIAVPGTGRETARVGFGGSGLMGGLSERESLLLLETAFDAGIRHFDVAPSYGHGQAERCLGKFLRGKAEQVTVATKYGILPPARAGLLGVARSMVRPAVRRLPAVRKRVAQAAAGLKTKAKFCAEEARRSLERSLRELSVDRIDIWLLHEVTAEDLDQFRPVAVSAANAAAGPHWSVWCRNRARQLEAVWQQTSRRTVRCCNSSGRCMDESSGISRRICHSPSRHFGRLGHECAICSSATLHSAAAGRMQWMPIWPIRKLLRHCCCRLPWCRTPNGMVLFSSRVPGHIRANVRALPKMPDRALAGGAS